MRKCLIRIYNLHTQVPFDLGDPLKELLLDEVPADIGGMLQTYGGDWFTVSYINETR